MLKNNGGSEERAYRISYTIRLMTVGMVLMILSGLSHIFDFLIFFIPITVTFATVRIGLPYGIACAAGISLSSLLMPETMFFLPSVLLLTLSGLGIGVGLSKSYSAVKTIFGVVFVLMLLFAVGGFYYYYVTGVRVSSAFIDLYRQTVATQPGLVQSLEQKLGVSWDVFLQQVELIFPSVLFIPVLLIITLNYYVSVTILNRHYGRFVYPNFGEFTLPGNVALGVIFLLLSMIGIQYSRWQYADNISDTLWIVLRICLYLQGLAVMFFWCRKKMTPLFGNFLMVSVSFIKPDLLMWVGFFDGIFNFRKQRR